MNLWHDISPERMQPEDFLAVIEIEKGSKNKYERCGWTGSSTRRRTTRPMTVLVRAPMQTTAIRWTCWFCAANRSVR